MKSTTALFQALLLLLIHGRAHGQTYSHTYDHRRKNLFFSWKTESYASYCLETTSGSQLQDSSFPNTRVSTSNKVQTTFPFHEYPNGFGGSLSQAFYVKDQIKKVTGGYRDGESCAQRCGSTTNIGTVQTTSDNFDLYYTLDCDSTPAPSPSPTATPQPTAEQVYYKSALCIWQGICYHENDHPSGITSPLYCMEKSSVGTPITSEPWDSAENVPYQQPEDWNANWFVFTWSYAYETLDCDHANNDVSDMPCSERIDDFEDNFSDGSVSLNLGSQCEHFMSHDFGGDNNDVSLYFCGNDDYDYRFSLSANVQDCSDSP